MTILLSFMPGLKGNPQAKHTTCVGRNWREWTIFFLEGQEKTMYCCKVKSTGMMSLTQSFIWGWAVERVIPSLLKKTQNNVSRWFFTNAVTVLQGLAYISLINNQNMTFKPFGVWNRNKWQSISRKKINTCDIESDQLIFWIWSSSTHKTSAKCTSQNYGFYELLWYSKC